MSKLISLFFKKIENDDLPTQAAAVAYYALLSLAPLSIGAILVWSFFPLTSSEELLTYIKQFLGPQAAEGMKVVLAQSQQPNLRAWAGVFAVLTILIFGTTVFNQLQASLDHIWRRSSSFVKNWFIQRLFSMLLFFGSITFLLVCSLATSVLKALEHQTGILILPVIPIVMLVFFALGLSAIYRWLSRKIIPWSAALQAGASTALLFELGKYLFQIYVKEAAVGSAYGAAGALVIFPLWVFYTALIFLVGAEVAYVLKEQPVNWYVILKKQKWYKKHSRLFWSGIGVFFVLLCARVLLPDFIKYRINRELEASDSWTGYVDDVDLSLWRGVVALKNFQLIEKKNEETKVEVKFLNANLSWLKLLNKEIHFNLEITDPLVIIKLGGDAPKEPLKIEKIDEARQAAVTEWPILINAVKIERMHLQVEELTETALPVFHLRNFNLVADNIWNKIEKQEGPSNVQFSGTTSGKGELIGEMWLSLFGATPNFRAQLKLKDMNLISLNPFFRKVANFDLRKGKLNIYSEFAGKNWNIDGYLKPILSDIDFVDLGKKKEKQSFWRQVWESLLQFAAEILKNSDTDDIAAKISFSGQLDSPGTKPWIAFLSIIRNAFVEGLGSHFDRDLKIKPSFPPKKK